MRSRPFAYCASMKTITVLAADTTADLDAVDPDTISAAFEVMGDVVGTACAEEPGRAVSHLITFTADEGDSRSEASAGCAAGFIPELSQVSATLTSGAAEACAALDGP